MTGLPIRRTLAGIAALGGLLAAFAGSPYVAQHATVDVERLAGAIAREEDHVTAIELATWIRDHRPGLRILDLRDATEFHHYHLPRAERVPLESLASTPFQSTDTLVLISDGGAHAAQAWVLLQALGHRNVFFLRGGLGEWIDDVMNPTIAADASPAAVAAFQRTSDISRYFGGVPRIVDKGQERPTRAVDSGTSSGRPSSSSDGTGTAAAVAAMRRRGC